MQWRLSKLCSAYLGPIDGQNLLISRTWLIGCESLLLTNRRTPSPCGYGNAPMLTDDWTCNDFLAFVHKGAWCLLRLSSLWAFSVLCHIFHFRSYMGYKSYRSDCLKIGQFGSGRDRSWWNPSSITHQYFETYFSGTHELAPWISRCTDSTQFNS